MNKTYRIIDANINRAKEGLRVVEDICRFVLDDETLTDKIKEIRHNVTELIKIPDSLLVAARGSDEDVARGRSVPRRKSLKQTFTANIKRVTEALRVMEEITAQGNEFKDLRYAVYDLEKIIYHKLRLTLPFENDVYVVSADVAVLKKAVIEGAAIVQLRDKNSDQDTIYQKALELAVFLKDKDALFILNDYPELAVKAGAHGVHIGQDVDDLKSVRAVVGAGFIVGRTTHSIEQGLKAVADGANYISVGPVYATPTKPGRKPVGLEYVREAAAKIEIPFVAIGGVDLSNLNEVLDAGASTVGIVRAADQTKKILEMIRNKK